MASLTSPSIAIAMHQWPDELTRTLENICLYEAEAVIDGERYAARSRRGAPFALARVLAAAGIPDQPVVVAHEGLRGAMTYRSLHRMAGRTIEEGARRSSRVGTYKEYPEGGALGGGKPENGGSASPGDTQAVLALVTPKSAAPPR